jgi:hypothetical protein
MTTCLTPIPYETLVAMWTGELPAEETDSLEEHLFSCDGCADRSHRLGLLVTELRFRHLPDVISHAHRARLVDVGVRVLNTEVPPGVHVNAFFGGDLDLLVHVLHADLTDAARVDLEMVSHDGVPLIRYDNVPFDPATGEVLVACQRHFEAMFPADGNPWFRMIAHDGEREWEVASFHVHHIWR